MHWSSDYGKNTLKRYRLCTELLQINKKKKDEQAN